MIELIVVVEGETDVPFLLYYFNRIIKAFNLKCLPLDNSSFIKTGSKDSLHLKNNEIEESLFKGKTVVVLFDADEDYKSSLENVKKQLAKELPIFLFPNNKDTGELETLLCQLVPEEHRAIFKCYDNYHLCIKALNKYSNFKEKGKILSYVEVVTPLNKAISLSQIRSYESNYWNMDSEDITPLKNFILKLEKK
jgi:hypothetical protein